MPSGFIDFDEREIVYRRLIELKSNYIKTAGVVSVTYTPIEKDGKADLGLGPRARQIMSGRHLTS